MTDDDHTTPINCVHGRPGGIYCPHCMAGNIGKPPTVREACRIRMPLSGTDAQALEHALTITERERDAVMVEQTKTLVRHLAAERDLRAVSVALGNVLADCYEDHADDDSGRARCIVCNEMTGEHDDSVGHAIACSVAKAQAVLRALLQPKATVPMSVTGTVASTKGEP